LGEFSEAEKINILHITTTTIPPDSQDYVADHFLIKIVVKIVKQSKI